jgi:hypothetical protein
MLISGNVTKIGDKTWQNNARKEEYISFQLISHPLVNIYYFSDIFRLIIIIIIIIIMTIISVPRVSADTKDVWMQGNINRNPNKF